MVARGSGKTAADWLAELADVGLVRPSVRTVMALDKLLRALRTRGVRDPAEIANSVAALLAKDDDHYHKIREHFLRSFLGEVPRGRTPFVSTDVDVARRKSALPVPMAEMTPVDTRWSTFAQRVGRWVGGRGWVFIGIVLVVAVGLYGPKEILSLVKPSLVKPALFAQTGIARFVELGSRPVVPPPVCEKPQPTLEIVSAPAAMTAMRVPTATAPQPLWLFLTLGAFSLLFGVVAVCWWAIDRPYAEDRARAKRDAQAKRDAVIGDTKSLGAVYDVERAPPFDPSAIDDAATLLARLARQETGYDLDVPRTIDETIAAGGRVKPVFARGGHRDALLVWVDIEGGDHPYRDGVEWLLERWRRLGVPFVRYDYRERPVTLERHPDNHPTSIDKLGRRTEGMPLLVFSRMVRPQDFRGKLPWLQQLEPWPVRAWIDLNPHGAHEYRGEVAALLPRIAARMPRYPFTKAGLLQCATMIAHRGQTPPQKKEMVVERDESLVETALAWWAGAAACVPNPTWVHLDDLRRFLPEVHDILSRPQDVQLLIDYTRRRSVGEGDLGHGESLRFSEEGRRVLLEQLRRADRQKFGSDNLHAYVEYRVRTRLIRQLEKARRADDAFGEAKRAMKMDVHRAAIGEVDIPALIEQHGNGPAAAELEPLLAELKHLRQAELPGPSKQRWTVALDDTLDAWLGRLRGARAIDFVRPHAWSIARSSLLVAGALVLANLALLWFVRPFQRSVEQTMEMPATWKVVIPDEPPALCDVAPMRFAKIPAGEFVMGSPPTEKDRDDDETQHRVRVGTFEMGIHEVTQRQWEVVMGTKPFGCDYGCAPNKPAQNVNMYDAMKFMNKLTDRENRGKPLEQQRTRCYDETNWSWDRTCTGYRLPTEAEWEYATRAGTTTAYSFGDEAKDLCTYGNGADLAARGKYKDWTVNEACDDGHADLAPVGNYKPNAWGLYDMHGNVWEWTWDKYGPYSDKPVTNDDDKPSDSDNVSADDRRVLRGGSFDFGPWWLRSAVRFGFLPTVSVVCNGFRCVRGHVASR